MGRSLVDPLGRIARATARPMRLRIADATVCTIAEPAPEETVSSDAGDLGKDDVRGVGLECAGWIGVLHDDDLPITASLNVVVERGNNGRIQRCGLVGSRRCLRIGWSIRDEGAVEQTNPG